jgi:hypothetical protein
MLPSRFSFCSVSALFLFYKNAAKISIHLTFWLQIRLHNSTFLGADTVKVGMVKDVFYSWGHLFVGAHSLTIQSPGQLVVRAAAM